VADYQHVPLSRATPGKPGNRSSYSCSNSQGKKETHGKGFSFRYMSRHHWPSQWVTSKRPDQDEAQQQSATGPYGNLAKSPEGSTKDARGVLNGLPFSGTENKDSQDGRPDETQNNADGQTHDQDNRQYKENERPQEPLPLIGEDRVGLHHCTSPGCST
jgi:hypothetical protein